MLHLACLLIISGVFSSEGVPGPVFSKILLCVSELLWVGRRGRESDIHACILIWDQGSVILYSILCLIALPSPDAGRERVCDILCDLLAFLLATGEWVVPSLYRVD